MSGIENSNSDYLETTSENINNNENLRSSVDEVLKKSTDEEIKLGVEAIKDLKSKQLAYYIESTFENEDGRADYQTMLTNPYYGFMVQAAIDLLSDKFNDSKFDKDGKQGDGEGYKSLDEWLQAGGGIDNNVGGKTKTAVRIVQNLLQIEVDGAAGPQFFAAVCAALKGENAPSNFRVRNKPNYTEKYNFNSSKQTVPISSEAGSESPTTFIMPLGYKLGNLENNQIKILNTTGNETGAYLKSENDGSFVVGYVDGYDSTSLGEFTISSDTNSITYIGPTEVKDIETENQKKLIKKLNLTESSESNFNFEYYGIPKTAKIFTRENYEGYYYFNGSDLVFISNFKSDNIKLSNKCYPAKQVLKNGDGEVREPFYNLDNTENIKTMLNKYFNKAMTDVGLNLVDKSVVYEDGKYFVESFGNKTQIDSKLLSDGYVFEGKDFPGELRVLNLANYYKYKINKDDLGRYKQSSTCGFRVTRTGGLYINNTPSTVSRGGIETDLIYSDKLKEIFKIDFSNETQLTRFANVLNKEVFERA